MAYKHTATSDGVYEQLKEQILHLELPPGVAISEIETAEKYNGVFTTSHDDNYFTSEVFLYLEAKPQKADVIMVK